jgi:hypothetical protein
MSAASERGKQLYGLVALGGDNLMQVNLNRSLLPQPPSFGWITIFPSWTVL